MSRLQRILSLGAGIAAMVLGVAVLIGWALDIAVLKSIRPDWVSMKPNTAVCFILLGFATLVTSGGWPTGGGQGVAAFVARLGTLLVGIIGLLSLAEFVFDWNPGLDQWLFPEPANTVGTSHPGRMAPDSAICFALLAAGLEFLRHAHRSARAQGAVLFLGMLVLTLALIEILTYFAPVLRTHGWGGWTMMAWLTAVLFAALGVALFALAWGKRPSRMEGVASPLDSSEVASAKLILIFAGLAVGIISVGGVYYRSHEREYRAEIEQRLATIANLKINQLVEWRRERMADGKGLFQNFSFSSMVRRFLEQPAALTPDANWWPGSRNTPGITAMIGLS